jgi:hypothetical protein
MSDGTVAWISLNGFASSHPAAALSAAKTHDTKQARRQALDKLAAQAQELKMGYDLQPISSKG